VPGGWVVAQQQGMTFVPDANHAWGGGTGTSRPSEPRSRY
jgi:hypothetical protein